MADEKWYDEYYRAVEKSRAYSLYCEKVFGRDFSQQGFSDLSQINFMLDVWGLKPASHILDVGCGNGKMLEYICGITGAQGVGFDISAVAIASAQKRIGQTNLTFEVGSIGQRQYAPGSFDGILSVDTMYFAPDLTETVSDMNRWLKTGGKLAIFYSEFRFCESDPLEKLLADYTDMAKAFSANHLRYDAYDLTLPHYELMKLKRRVIAPMKEVFRQEGTEMLYQNAFTESIDESMTYDDFRKFSARYLYIAQKA